MIIKRIGAITPKKCAELIKKRFKLDDIIIIYNENPAPPYDEGWAIDTAGYVIKTLNDPEVFFDPDKKYHFTVGLVKLNTNTDYL